jgi:hypothetical protein
MLLENGNATNNVRDSLEGMHWMRAVEKSVGCLTWHLSSWLGAAQGSSGAKRLAQASEPSCGQAKLGCGNTTSTTSQHL